MIHWSSSTEFSIEGLNFRLANWGKPVPQSNSEEFIVFKPQWMIERYLTLIQKLQPQYIMELGIRQGGSTAFFHRACNTNKLVAIELETAEIQALSEYSSSLNDQSLRTVYGIDQADTDALNKLCDEEFNEREIDLVIDDASHFLEESRSSFNTLFPKLRPGGAYVIEDWPWAHDSIETREDDWPAFWPDKEPLTKLIFEILIACPSVPDLIETIEIDKNSAVVYRGKAAAKSNFDISKCALARGRALIP